MRKVSGVTPLRGVNAALRLGIWGKKQCGSIRIRKPRSEGFRRKVLIVCTAHVKAGRRGRVGSQRGSKCLKQVMRCVRNCSDLRQEDKEVSKG